MRKPNILLIMTDQQRADYFLREGFALNTMPFLEHLSQFLIHIHMPLALEYQEVAQLALDEVRAEFARRALEGIHGEAIAADPHGAQGTNGPIRIVRGPKDLRERVVPAPNFGEMKRYDLC